MSDKNERELKMTEREEALSKLDELAEQCSVRKPLGDLEARFARRALTRPASSERHSAFW